MTLSERSIPLGGMRGMIAARMMESLRTTAQLTFHAECEVTSLLAVRAKLKDEGSSCGVEDIIILALARALSSHPSFNGSVVDDSIVVNGSIHVATAIALPNGLVAPCLRNVQAMDLNQIAAARADLVARARAGKIKVQEMTGGTITISNMGQSRVSFFTPILNLPQIAIVGIGCIRVQDTASQTRRSTMGLSLTVDHRAVDGAPAGAFLSRLCEEIEGIASYAG
jgi:pyruvate dehydrogenase E2 component (dihydrolipoamide acetyltransferase)